MKDIKPVKGLKHLQQLIEAGEHEHQDFKYLISDSRKIARSISAFANNDGGRLLIGVKDNGAIAGVRSEEDLYMIQQAAQRYCQPEVEVTYTAIKAGRDITVFIANIPRAFERPIEVLEEHNTRQAYYRVKDMNVIAHPLMVASWKYSRRPDGTIFTTSDAESVILRHLQTAPNNQSTHNDIALACHISLKSAATAITRLASMGLLTFVYDSHQFKISLPDAND